VLPVVQKERNRLRVVSAEGEVEFKGAIGSFLGVSELLVGFVATAGPGVEALASELMANDEELPAMIANAVGAERAEAAESAVIDQVQEKIRAIGYAPTLPYSPGYCGMALTEQRTLFGLFGGETAGVMLTPACLMRPIKSVSGLVGLAPAEIVENDGSPCDRCELHNCNMRR
jgi:cobalamin-dependent methionine synthase I